MKTTTLILLTLAVATVAFATQPDAPEIDPGSSISALSVLAGTVLVLRSRRNK